MYLVHLFMLVVKLCSRALFNVCCSAILMDTYQKKLVSFMAMA